MTHDASRLINAPGWLYHNPTGLIDTADYGTSLGFTEAGLRVTIDHHTAPVFGEEFGEEPIDRIDLGASITLTLEFAQWDRDALTACFPAQAANAATYNRADVSWPGAEATESAGVARGALAGRFVWIPDDTDNNPIVLAHAGAMRLAPEARLAFSLGTPLTLPVVIDVDRADATVAPTDPQFGYRRLFIGAIAAASVKT